MVKFNDFSRPMSVFPVLFTANLIFKGFKTVLYIQVLFKPVQTLFQVLHIYSDVPKSLTTAQLISYLVRLDSKLVDINSGPFSKKKQNPFSHTITIGTQIRLDTLFHKSLTIYQSTFFQSHQDNFKVEPVLSRG